MKETNPMFYVGQKVRYNGLDCTVVSATHYDNFSSYLLRDLDFHQYEINHDPEKDLYIKVVVETEIIREEKNDRL